MDQDGYGYRADDRGIERLLQDSRTLSPAGIERAGRIGQGEEIRVRT